MKELSFMINSKMAEMKDKDKLKKLVDIIGDLLKIEGNEWLIDEILKIIGEASPIEEIAKHSLIQNIHEYCIEQKIEKQANEFYSSFPIDEIKQQLIQDYKKMEHERRRDDFENFCLCVYQQVENITNYLHEHLILDIWENNKNKIAYKFPDGKVLTQSDIIFGNANDWFANVKFKAVLYYIYYSKNIKVIIPFNERVKIFNELYQVRNLNHRGSEPTEFQQKQLDKIKGNESKYYFKFYGFLQDFISRIEIYRHSKYAKEDNTKRNKKNNIRNTIGENNPELQKLLNHMNDKK